MMSHAGLQCAVVYCKKPGNMMLIVIYFLKIEVIMTRRHVLHIYILTPYILLELQLTFVSCADKMPIIFFINLLII